ncbi:helix-turn-helix domain-containing protein [Microbaculum marinum]|uniref:Helix-turn-helix domain-containing protein n=1 Tax=Microbaculum marinum TaxID=1764581 RepID=A0AAW9RHC8_9HYPH
MQYRKGGGAPRHLDSTEAQLVRRVARAFRVREAALFADARTSAQESLARHTAMYLMHVVLRRTYADVAALFSRHRTSVLYACARIEDRRDDRAFDARIARLERSLAELEDA